MMEYVTNRRLRIAYDVAGPLAIALPLGALGAVAEEQALIHEGQEPGPRVLGRRRRRAVGPVLALVMRAVRIVQAQAGAVFDGRRQA